MRAPRNPGRGRPAAARLAVGYATDTETETESEWESSDDEDEIASMDEDFEDIGDEENRDPSPRDGAGEQDAAARGAPLQQVRRIDLPFSEKFVIVEFTSASHHSPSVLCFRL